MEDLRKAQDLERQAQEIRRKASEKERQDKLAAKKRFEMEEKIFAPIFWGIFIGGVGHYLGHNIQIAVLASVIVMYMVSPQKVENK